MELTRAAMHAARVVLAVRRVAASRARVVKVAARCVGVPPQPQGGGENAQQQQLGARSNTGAGSSLRADAALFLASLIARGGGQPTWGRPRAPHLTALGAGRGVLRSSQGFDRNWLKADPLVLGLGFLGWTVPSTIGVSAFGGNSLFGLLTTSIGEELAHFPTGEEPSKQLCGRGGVVPSTLAAQPHHRGSSAPVLACRPRPDGPLLALPDHLAHW